MTESNLNVPKTERCAFCDYLSGRRPFTILCRSEKIAILVTREQRGIGHVIVIPVRHVPTLLELDATERHALIDAVAAVASAIDNAFERPGIAVWQNNGTAAHQTIPHAHFHVAGTLPGRSTEFGDVPELSVEETDRIAAQIREVSDNLC
ncbi:HIT family protein [Nocardia gamkensis]|uniref:HIT family protein n=1 Tax=Nocardia gamkensis TaxID=352869 RepID=A0A7X6R400_9NOCA|nr:HIT family protein [Nocardia gamkensis]NKY27791.1 HIT family protein [Nocardia gamkensis]